VVDELDTEYLLWLDDDIIFDHKTLEALVERMKNNPEFGWISPYLWEIKKGEYHSHASNWMTGGNTILRRVITPDIASGFQEVDQPSSVGIYRKEMLDEVSWNDDVKIGREHILFAWDVEDTDWKCGFDPTVSFKHGGCQDIPDYDKLRNRMDKGDEAVRKETGFTNIRVSEVEPTALIGCGSGRCGTRSLANLINKQSRWECEHEKNSSQPLPWKVDHALAYDRIDWFNERNKRGDVAFYYLPYVELMLEEVIGLKVVCLKRDMHETVDSFLRWMARRWNPPRNPWIDHDGKKWTKNEKWDAPYPNIEIPISGLAPEEYKREQIKLYWINYYEQAEWLQDRYSDRFRIFDIDVLNEREKQKKLFNFIGIENPRFEVGIKTHESEAIK